MITKTDMEGRARRHGPRRDGGGKTKKPQATLWACSGDKRVCTQKEHPRIRCAVHGSKEEAERCNRRAQKAQEQELNA